MNKFEIFKNLLLVSIISTALLMIPAAAGDVYLDPSTSNGDITYVEIHVDATNYQGGDIELTYDATCCEVTNFARNTGIFDGGSWDSNTDGREMIRFDTSAPLNTDCLVGTLTIECVGQNGDQTDLIIDNDESIIFNDMGAEISTGWQNGHFSCDGVVDPENIIYLDPSTSTGVIAYVEIYANATNYQGGDIELTYDATCCEVTEFVRDPIFDGGSWDSNTDGREMIRFDTATPLNEVHLIGTLTIECVGQEGCTTDLIIDNDESILFDDNGVDISPLTLQNGQFTCSLNNPPSVTVNYPNNGKVSGTITLSATAGDTDGTITNVEFSYSATGTAPWTVLGSGADVGAGVYEYSWDTMTVSDGSNYKIKAEATDNDGATGEDTSNDVFEIDNTCQCDFCLDLVSGLNLVSIPKTIDAASISGKNIFDIDSLNGEYCYYLDATTMTYQTNPDVKPCRSFWVYKNNPKQVCVDFTDLSVPSQQLLEGWNMIGHIHTTSMDVNSFAAATGLEDDGTLLFRQLNTYTQSTGYSYYHMGDFNDVYPGVGYLILMKQDTMMYGMQ